MTSSCRRFQGKVVLLSAGTAGIGLGIAERLGQEGAAIVLCSRKEANVKAAIQQLRAAGIDASGCAAHVGSKVDLQKFVQLAVEKYGRIDVLISNAAVNPAAGLILDMPDGAIDKILDINVKSAILLAKAAKPHMPKGSNMVFISSYTAFHPEAPIAMYAISKTAVVALTKALAEELGPDQIRVNCVAPGTVPTKFAAALVETLAMAEANIARTFLGRLGTPQDMAAAVAYLASDDASYVTGETLVVAGGMQSRL